MDRDAQIIAISDEILTALLQHREKNPDFTFALRQRDSTLSKEKRLEKGYWFQGSHYIFVPLFKRGDTARKINTIGFSLTFDEDGSILSNHIELSFKGGISDKSEIDFYKDLATSIGLSLNAKTTALFHTLMQRSI